MVEPFLSSPVTLGALRLPLRSPESVRSFVAEVCALERSRGALELSVARLLAWLHRRDSLELGSVTWTAFCGRHVDWGASWIRAMIRLVESPLEKVKEAVADGLLPVRRAVLAPGRVAVAEQVAWLADAVLGRVTTGDAELVVFAGKDAEIIRRARHLARLLLGWAAPPREVDAYVVRCWRDRVPLERLLTDARTPPPPPPPPPAPLRWADEGEPSTVAEAMDRLERAQSALRGMTTVLARAWSRINYEHLYEEAGFDTAAEAARHLLGMSLRSAQRLSALGWGLEWYPEIDAAIQAGMAPRTAAALLEVVGDNDACKWLDLAARVGRREFVRAVAAAREECSNTRTLARYREAAAIADRWAATPEGKAVLDRPFGSASVSADPPALADAHPTVEASAPSSMPQATAAGGPGAALGPAAESDPSIAKSAPVNAPAPGTTSAGGPRLGVALPHPEPKRFASTSLRAAPEMLAAATWFLETVLIPRPRGFGRVKERDGDRCTNPECGRRSLRIEAHHLIPRAQGGPDEPWNGTGACRVCHLRGLHGGHLEAVRVVVEGHEAVLWRWPDGRQVLRFRDEPGTVGRASPRSGFLPN